MFIVVSQSSIHIPGDERNGYPSYSKDIASIKELETEAELIDYCSSLLRTKYIIYEGKRVNLKQTVSYALES